MPTTEQRVTHQLADETNRLIAERLPLAAWALIIVFGIAWIFERAAHPQRDLVYAIIYASEIVTVVVALMLSRQPAWRPYARQIAVATAILLLLWVAAYHLIVRGEAEVLTLAFLYVLAATMVVLPWGWQGQLPVAVTALLVYTVAMLAGRLTTLPTWASTIGLITIGSMSVAGAAFMTNYRLALLRQAAELRLANEALAAANETKNQFLASVSHELRTPLNIIVGYTDLLLEAHFGELPSEALQALQRIAQSSRTLTYLINDLLDLARIEAGRLTVNIERVALRPVFKDMREFIAPRLATTEVQLSTDVVAGLAVLADRQRLEQILVNLLSNAAKFTKQGEIRLCAVADGNAVVAIEVHDTGPGIEAAELPKLFEPFAQGALGLKHGGVGIGLSVSQRLAHAMNGSLAVTSRVGEGSTFTLRLPAVV